MGMAFDPDFNNTRYIYAAYTYSEIAGQEVAGQDPVELFRSENRYRDVEFSPDGRSIYVITDSSGPVQAIVDEIYFLS